MEHTHDKKAKKKHKTKPSVKKSSLKKPKGAYKVVFKGRLLPGFSQEQVIANISSLTKLSPEKVQSKIFCGKSVIIRRADTESHAKQLQLLFTEAGLEVVILKTVQKIQQQHAQAKEKSNKEIIAKEIKTTIKKRKLPIVAIVLWGVFFAVLFNLWSQYHIDVSTPDEIVKIEQALADKPLLFLAHINVGELIAREDFFNELFSDTQSKQVQSLKNNGLIASDSDKGIAHIVSGAYFEEQALVSQTIITGQFDVQSVYRYLLSQYVVKTLSNVNFMHLRISNKSMSQCEQSQSMEVSIEPERIIISSEGHLDDAHNILANGGNNDKALTPWFEYQDDKLVSLAIFAPQKDQLKAKIPELGMAGFFAKDFAKKNQALESLFFGVGLQLFPAAAIIDARLNSSDEVWLSSIEQQLQTQMRQLKAKSVGLESVLNVLAKVSIQDKTLGAVSMQLQVDNELKKSIVQSSQDLLGRFFSVDISGNNAVKAAQISERLNNDPQVFWPQYNQHKLKTFNTAFDIFFKPVWTRGPFAIEVDDLLLQTDDGVDHIVLQLDAKGQNIDNVGDKSASLLIKSVLDERGQNLIAPLGCGHSMANKTVFSRFGGARTASIKGQLVHYNELSAKKKIKLKKGVKQAQIKSINGEIKLNLATKVERKELVKEDKNQLLKQFNSRILFKPSNAQTLSYTLSGSTENILAIRALNKDRKYLSRSSMTAMDNAFSAGRSVTQEYAGHIAFIEVVYAAKLIALNYPIEIKQLPPYPTPEQGVYELEGFQVSTLEKWDKEYQGLEPLSFAKEHNWLGKQNARWHAGPLNLALYALKTSRFWGTTGSLQIKTHRIDELQHNLSALEIFIEYPQPDKKGYRGKSYYYPLEAKGHYVEKEFVPDEKQPYMDGQLAFSLPYKNDKIPLKTLKGEVNIHLPISTHSVTFTNLGIGAIWEDEGLRLKLVRLGNDEMEFKVLNKRSRLLKLILLNADNKRISSASIYRSSHDEQRDGNIVVSYHGKPIKARVTVSEGQKIKTYPFEFKIKN